MRCTLSVMMVAKVLVLLERQATLALQVLHALQTTLALQSTLALHESVEQGEIAPGHIGERDMVADSCTLDQGGAHQE